MTGSVREGGINAHLDYYCPGHLSGSADRSMAWLPKRSWADLFTAGVIDVEIKAETYDEFIARGGQVHKLKTTDRALTCPNREFSIMSQGQRERKQQQERQKVALRAR